MNDQQLTQLIYGINLTWFTEHANTSTTAENGDE